MNDDFIELMLKTFLIVAGLYFFFSITGYKIISIIQNLITQNLLLVIIVVAIIVYIKSK